MGSPAGLVVKLKAPETRKDNNMRRYCKNVDITDTGFIECCIYLWLDEKKKRRDVQRFLAQYSQVLNFRDIQDLLASGQKKFLEEIVHNITLDIQKRIKQRKLDLPPIFFKLRYDDCCCKWRKIGIEAPIHQIFDYIVVEACKDLFYAKIGPYQMASIPDRGQEQGVKAIFKWMQTDPTKTRYFVKLDVRQCYPSIPHDKLKAVFTRDIKNPTLLWLIYELIDAFPTGLSIGSYFSQFACNYYLSRIYHYIAEKLYRVQIRRGNETRVRLIHHHLFYMDDILLLASSKKDAGISAQKVIEYAHDILGLEIKSNWKVVETDYIGKGDKHHGHFVDMMGYRIYRDHITIRRTTFKRCRRAVIRVEVRLKEGKDIPLSLARRVSSHNGRFKYSDSFAFSSEHNVPKIVSACGRVISSDTKRRILDNEDRSTRISKARGALLQYFDDSEHWKHYGSVDQAEYQTAGGICPF